MTQSLPPPRLPGRLPGCLCPPITCASTLNASSSERPKPRALRMPPSASLPSESLDPSPTGRFPAGRGTDREAAEPGAGPPAGLSTAQCEALVRVIEAAPQVRRRHHFFLWSQGSLQSLLPHKVVVCGAYQRQRKELVHDAFHSVVLPGAVLELLSDSHAALMRSLSAAWVQGGGRALCVELTSMAPPPPAVPHAAVDCAAAQRELLLGCGIGQLLVHGVSRPQRPHEIESLFVFATPGGRSTVQHAVHLELLLPFVHSIWRRVQGLEGELCRPGAPATPLGGGPALSARERQILAGLCRGLSNPQLGEQLGLSPLTVKNHVQKILRKLGAANRAHAVASALSLDLLACDADAALP